VLQPKRTKYRKQFKGRNAGLAMRGSSVAFGEFGLKATSRARMTAREIEAARRAMAHYVKRGGQIWIRVFPDVPISKKPLEVRMGSGKGNIEYWIARVQPGKVLFEMEGVDEVTAREAFRLAGSKLSVSTMFVKRQVREMDAKELRSKKAPELADELVKLRKEQFSLRLQRATGQLPKPDQYQKVRRNIARLKTVMSETRLRAAGEKK
jgi:large subunit ribosomal protein L16